jgi:hypothetical protein
MVKEKLHKFIENPDNEISNFELGKSYYDLKQYATAFNYLFRAAELAEDKNLAYRSLLLCGLCLEKQGNRKYATVGLYLQAKALLPMRPEANYLCARSNYNHSEWFECYTECRSSLVLCDYSYFSIEDVEYPGQYAFQILQAISGWHTGKREESESILKGLYDNYIVSNSNIDVNQKNLIVDYALKLKLIGPNNYDESFNSKLKFKFPGSDIIKKNHSDTYQDLMAISLANGKRNGTYLEIGSSHPYKGNNTALLEEVFEWRGVSVDINQKLVEEFNSVRKNKSILHDATTLNYAQVLEAMSFPADIDYLQLDCESSKVTYEALQKIPFDKYQFAFVTFNHDFYNDDRAPYRDWSRSYLIDKGYIPVVNDVSISSDKSKSYEDWWIHPDLVDLSIFQKLKVYGRGPNPAEDFMFS